jgi:hypothetical protein
MPAVINFAANLVLGSAVPLVLRRSPALRRELMSWQLLALVGFEALVFTPVATYLFRFYPQWSMLYMFDPQIFPELDNWIGALSLMAVLLNFAAALGAFYATREGLLRGAGWLTYGALTTGGALAVILLALFARRIGLMGDYDAFWQGNADLFLVRLGGWIGLLLYAAAGLFVAFLHTRFADRDPSLV